MQRPPCLCTIPQRPHTNRARQGGGDTAKPIATPSDAPIDKHLSTPSCNNAMASQDQVEEPADGWTDFGIDDYPVDGLYVSEREKSLLGGLALDALKELRSEQTRARMDAFQKRRDQRGRHRIDQSTPVPRPADRHKARPTNSEPHPPVAGAIEARLQLFDKSINQLLSLVDNLAAESHPSEPTVQATSRPRHSPLQNIRAQLDALVAELSGLKQALHELSSTIQPPEDNGTPPKAPSETTRAELRDGRDTIAASASYSGEPRTLAAKPARAVEHSELATQAIGSGPPPDPVLQPDAPEGTDQADEQPPDAAAVGEPQTTAGLASHQTPNESKEAAARRAVDSAQPADSAEPSADSGLAAGRSSPAPQPGKAPRHHPASQPQPSQPQTVGPAMERVQPTESMVRASGRYLLGVLRQARGADSAERAAAADSGPAPQPESVRHPRGIVGTAG